MFGESKRRRTQQFIKNIIRAIVHEGRHLNLNAVDLRVNIMQDYEIVNVRNRSGSLYAVTKGRRAGELVERDGNGKGVLYIVRLYEIANLDTRFRWDPSYFEDDHHGWIIFGISILYTW